MPTEEHFKDMLRAELDARPAPPMPDIVRRATEGGRRRARRRAAGQALGVTLAGAVIATGVVGIVGVTALRSAGADVTSPAAELPGPMDEGDGNPPFPTQPVADNPLADRLPDIIEGLLPLGDKTSASYTNIDGGVYVAVDWETGQGLVDVVFGITGERFFGCTRDEGGRPQAKPNDGVQCGTTPDGVLLGRYAGTNATTGITWREIRYAIGDDMVTPSYANGPLSSVAQPTRPTLPLTDDDALALLRNPAWQTTLDEYTAPPAAPWSGDGVPVHSAAPSESSEIR